MKLHSVTDCQTLSLVDLAERVVYDGDTAAIIEIHGRPLFVWGRTTRLCLADFVAALMDSRLPRSVVRQRTQNVNDKAFGLTIDKFYNLPPSISEDDSPESTGAPAEGRSKVDCRHNYRAFLDLYAKGVDPLAPALERDRFAEETLQQLVRRHFLLSLRESSRSESIHVHRYTRTFNGAKVTLYMPRWMTGREKRRWLEERMENLDFSNPIERHRVQEIVDDELNANLASRHQQGIQEAMPRYGRTALPWSVEHEVSTKGLAQALADEKAEMIDALRPSIRELGRARLRQLIKDVFVKLSRGGYPDAELAAQHGLSKSSFSRFCGSLWAKTRDKPEACTVPDLWKNLAELLARHPKFVAAAKTANVWGHVQATISVSQPEGAEGSGDE